MAAEAFKVKQTEVCPSGGEATSEAMRQANTIVSRSEKLLLKLVP